jgi:hypothetical protein
MSKPKTGLESLGAQIASCSKTLLLHNFKRREIVHCKTDRGGGGVCRLFRPAAFFNSWIKLSTTLSRRGY